MWRGGIRSGRRPLTGKERAEGRQIAHTLPGDMAAASCASFSSATCLLPLLPPSGPLSTRQGIFGMLWTILSRRQRRNTCQICGPGWTALRFGIFRKRLPRRGGTACAGLSFWAPPVPSAATRWRPSVRGGVNARCWAFPARATSRPWPGRRRSSGPRTWPCWTRLRPRACASCCLRATRPRSWWAAKAMPGWRPCPKRTPCFRRRWARRDWPGRWRPRWRARSSAWPTRNRWCWPVTCCARSAPAPMPASCRWTPNTTPSSSVWPDADRRWTACC